MICGVGGNVSNHQVSEPTQVVSEQAESNSISRTSGPKLKNRYTSDNIFDVEYVFDSNIDNSKVEVLKNVNDRFSNSWNCI